LQAEQKVVVVQVSQSSGHGVHVVRLPFLKVATGHLQALNLSSHLKSPVQVVQVLSSEQASQLVGQLPQLTLSASLYLPTPQASATHFVAAESQAVPSLHVEHCLSALQARQFGSAV